MHCMLVHAHALLYKPALMWYPMTYHRQTHPEWYTVGTPMIQHVLRLHPTTVQTGEDQSALTFVEDWWTRLNCQMIWLASPLQAPM